MSGLAAYGRVAGISAEPEEFMKMALDAARTFLVQADAALAAGDRPRKAKALSSAAKVIEFMLGLSGFEGGPLSDCLASVYHYVLAAILKANAWDDREAIAAGRVALDDLAAVWRRVFPDAVADARLADSALTGRESDA
ncbi:MAG TPA: flagellar protein FliS [Stellaceae bacterium]|nr:flagellar protein FliS [Stellaceae bacterium]